MARTGVRMDGLATDWLSCEGHLCPPLRGKVLIAEDNPLNQAVALAMLERMGLTGVVASDGGQAVTMVRDGAFDLVLMDCQMPLMDGFEATAQIRRLDARRGGQVPIVALTANAMPGDEQRCLAAGMDAFLAKPYTMANLHTVLARWLTNGPPAAESEDVASRTALEAQPSRAEEAVIDLAVLDSLRAIDESGGNGLAKEVVGLFVRDAAKSWSQVQSAAAASDATALAKAAHTLKSSAANVGAVQLADGCRKIEALAREGRMPDALAWVEPTGRAHRNATARLQQLLLEME